MDKSVFYIIFLSLVSCGLSNKGFINNKVLRKVDIGAHLVKIYSVITTQSEQDTNDKYVVAIDSGYEDSLSFIGAMSKVGEEDKEFVVTESKESTSDSRRFDLNLGPRSAGKPLTFTLVTVFAHKLVPYPSEIAQSEKQLVQFVGNLFFYSPYPTQTQETQVVLSSSNVITYTQSVKPVNKQDAAINYGPYKDKPAFSKEELQIHYENNSPFLTVTSMTRWIELSHWGNIAVEETLDVYHSGARLRGSFSRYDYQRHQDGASSIKAIKMVLPAAARDVYYRDEIGNISTSHMRELSDSVELELRPRFPLFGGWKTHYTIGYNVPSYEYLFHKGDMFGLKMRFVDHVYDDQVIDHLTTKIVLPEGVSDIRFEPPYPVQLGPRETIKTYLDLTGRTVIVAHKANLVDNHIRDFKLYYHFKTMHLIREPLMVVAAFYILFMTVIIYARLDFSITKDEATESKMRVDGLTEEVQTTQDKRSALYQAYEDAINKFKANKDAAKFAADRKKIDGDHRQLTQQIAALQAKLKPDSAEAAEKVNELQIQDARYREQVTLGVQLAEKLVAGKMNKAQYLEAEPKISAKKAETIQKMEVILGSL